MRATDALRVFNDCRTQWRVGFGGAYGLIYEEARESAREFHVDWLEVKPLVQALEGERLAFDSEKDAEEDAQRKQKQQNKR
jgi:hypothetical protein